LSKKEDFSSFLIERINMFKLVESILIGIIYFVSMAYSFMGQMDKAIYNILMCIFLVVFNIFMNLDE